MDDSWVDQFVAIKLYLIVLLLVHNTFQVVPLLPGFGMGGPFLVLIQEKI